MMISVVIPAFNEEARIGNTLERVLDYLGPRGSSAEVIVVDDGSSDRTVEVSSRFKDRVRLLRFRRNRGKGAAVREGMLAARGDYRIFTDADLSTPIREIEPLLRELENGADLCLGSRALDRRRVIVHQPWYRETMGKIFNGFVRLAAVRGISDTQCGFKGLRADAALDLLPRMKIDGFSFDVELILLAQRRGYLVRQIPVEWHNSPRSRVNPVTDSSRMLWDLLKIRWIHRNTG